MAEKTQKTSPESDEKWVVSTQDVAYLFGITTRSVRKWKDAGCPHIEGARGKWRLKDVIEWKVNMFLPDKDADPEDLKKREAVAETRWKEERALVKQFEREIMEGKYHPHDEVVQAWASRVVELKSALLNLVKQFPKEHREDVRESVYDFLAQYARDGKYTPKKA